MRIGPRRASGQNALTAAQQGELILGLRAPYAVSFGRVERVFEATQPHRTGAAHCHRPFLARAAAAGALVVIAEEESLVLAATAALLDPGPVQLCSPQTHHRPPPNGLVTLHCAGRRSMVLVCRQPKPDRLRVSGVNV